MRKRQDKRGQMKMSFGMIFSIILIVFFLAFAFYAIKTFLSTSDTGKVGKFKSELQEDIDKIWKGEKASQGFEGALPNGVQYVCFVDFAASARGEDQGKYNELKNAFYGSENIVFYPVGSAEGFDSAIMKNINLDKTLSDANPLCIKNVNGKTRILLSKDYGENLVTLSRV